MRFEGDPRGPARREASRVGLEDPDLGLEAREVGDLREGLAAPDDLPDLRQLSPPVPLQDDDSGMGGLQLESGQLALGLVDLQLRLPAVEGDQVAVRPREPLALAAGADGVPLLLGGEAHVDVGLDDLVTGEELRVAALEGLGGRPLAAGLVGVASEVRDEGARLGAVLPAAKPGGRALGPPVREELHRLRRVEAEDDVPGLDLGPVLDHPADLQAHVVPGDANGGRVDRAENSLGPGRPRESRLPHDEGRHGGVGAWPEGRAESRQREGRDPDPYGQGALHEEAPPDAAASRRTEAPSASPERISTHSPLRRPTVTAV